MKIQSSFVLVSRQLSSASLSLLKLRKFLKCSLHWVLISIILFSIYSLLLLSSNAIQIFLKHPSEFPNAFTYFFPPLRMHCQFLALYFPFLNTCYSVTFPYKLPYEIFCERHSLIFIFILYPLVKIFTHY